MERTPNNQDSSKSLFWALNITHLPRESPYPGNRKKGKVRKQENLKVILLVQYYKQKMSRLAILLQNDSQCSVHQIKDTTDQKDLVDKTRKGKA